MAATRRIDLDEELIERARNALPSQADRSDAEVIEHALTMYLGDRAFETALAQGPLEEPEAEALAREALRAARSPTA